MDGFRLSKDMKPGSISLDLKVPKYMVLISKTAELWDTRVYRMNKNN